MVLIMYKVNTAIIVFYQANNARTGRTIQMNVYDEAQALDAPKSGTMTEIGSTGRYYRTFTPDALGTWSVQMYDTVGLVKGEAMITYKVGNSDVDSIQTDVSAVKAKTDNLPSDPADQSLVEAKIDSTESDIRGTDGDDLKTLSDQIDDIGSPAMVG